MTVNVVFNKQLCVWFCMCMCLSGVHSGLFACMWRMQEGLGCPPLSLSAWPFDTGSLSLSLNLWLVLSWLDWKPASPSDPLVSVSLGAGVTGCLACYADVGI